MPFGTLYIIGAYLIHGLGSIEYLDFCKKNCIIGMLYSAELSLITGT